MPSVKSPGAEIHFRVEGEGPTTLLMIVGVGANSDEWGPGFVEALARRHRVIRFDNRGVPPSTSSAPDFGIGDMAADALAVLDAVDARSTDVLGWSMGGLIAEHLALEHPDRVARLVLVSTRFGGVARFPMRPRAAALYEPPAPGTTATEYFRKTFEVLTAPGFASRHPELSELFIRGRLEHRVGKQLALTQTRAAHFTDLSDRLRTLSIPSLVVHGRDDPTTVVENGRALAEAIPGAKLLEFADCGHFPTWEHPRRLLEELTRFLRRARS